MFNTKNILPMTLIRRDLANILKNMENNSDPIVITKDGKAAGVLMGTEAFDGLIETLEILSHPEFVKKIKRAKSDMDKGQSYTHDEVFA